MKKAYSIKNVKDAKFRVMPFGGQWKAAMGEPELGGSLFIMGPPKNGKTSLAMALACYIAGLGYRVAYDSVEEGLSKSIQDAVRRTFDGQSATAQRKFVLLNKEGVPELMERLKRQRSPEVVVIDSVQFLGLTWAEYKLLKETFPNKLFIYVSHVDGNKPEGRVAVKIWRDANVFFRVEGFRGLPTGRYGGGAPIDVYPEAARRYWDLQGDVERRM